MTATEHGGRKVITARNGLPPWPALDWCAYFDGDEEAGEYGYGATEQDAVNDLISTYGEIDENE